MKKIFTFILGVGTMLCANAQMAEGVQARIYAYDLQQEETTAVVNNTTVKAYNFTFKTNTAATGTPTVTLFGDGLNDVVIQATATDNTNKSWTATVHAANGEIVAGSYNWKVTVSADPVTKFQTISANDGNSTFSYFRSYALAVDKAPESNNFGRIYVTNQKAGTTTTASEYGKQENRETTVGIYTYSPNLNPENNASAYSCDLVGDISKSGASPKDMTVGSDGVLYMTVHEASKSGVYIINPTDFSYSAIFKGTRNTNGQILTEDGKYVVGLPYCAAAIGTGEDRELYVINGEEHLSININHVSRYKIGASTTWSTEPSSKTFAYTYNAVNNTNYNVRIYATQCAIEPISTGGYWISYYYNSTNKGKANIPTLIYCDNNNICKFNIEGEGVEETGNGRQGALAVLDDKGIVAYSDASNTVLLKYTTKNDETITVDTESLQRYTRDYQGSYSNAYDFDYAGNLYAVTSGAECMAVYAIPDTMMGENTRTTPAKSTLLAVFSDGDKLTSIDGINADANAPVEYYNLQGVKVENPEKGIFIKKQGSKTTKVVF